VSKSAEKREKEPSEAAFNQFIFIATECVGDTAKKVYIVLVLRKSMKIAMEKFAG
jgi:hypothetical protein